MRLFSSIASLRRYGRKPRGRHVRPRHTARIRPYTRQTTAERSPAPVTVAPADLRDPAELDALFQRRRLVHPAYEAWERGESGEVMCGDGLDDLRAELGPLLRRLLEPESAPAGSLR